MGWMRVRCGWSQRFASDDDGEGRKGGPDASPSLLYIEPRFAELGCVVAGAFVVGEDGDSSGLEDTRDVVES